MRLPNRAGPRMCVACCRIVDTYDPHHIIYVKKQKISFTRQENWMANLCLPCHSEITSRNAKAAFSGLYNRIQTWMEFLTDTFFVINSVAAFELRKQAV
jgi:hypothetical protein